MIEPGTLVAVGKRVFRVSSIAPNGNLRLPVDRSDRFRQTVSVPQRGVRVLTPAEVEAYRAREQRELDKLDRSVARLIRKIDRQDQCPFGFTHSTQTGEDV